MSEGQVPVVIAGAGPVGLTLALSLARGGVRSLVLEKKQELDVHSRATLLVSRSLAHFEKLGVLPAFLAQGQRTETIRILRSTDRRPILSFDFAPLGDRTTTPYVLALSQDRTERILLNSVIASGMVEVAFADAFERFEQQGAAVLVTSATGRKILTSFLVGADGAHSAVRGQLGWSLEGKTYPTRAVLADVRIAPEADNTDGWLADLDAASFTIAIRFGENAWRIIEAAVPDDVTDDMLVARAQERTSALFGTHAWRATTWTAAYRKHERRSPHYASGRVILAGDAAHLNSPAGGQGLNVGLADAEELASALLEALTADDRVPQLLRDYERQRIATFDDQVRGFTDNLEMMESAPAWLRRLGFSMIGILRAAGLEKRVAAKLSMLDDGHI
jgi:3-(3-hydroxy-phenyl)propionate hydroxylase